MMNKPSLSQPDPARRAFTLTELMVVLAVLTMLGTLLMAATGQDEERANRQACVNNLRQMGVGSFAYAQDDSRRAFSGVASDRDDDLNWLYPQYVRSLDVFRCPSTQTFVRPPMKQAVTDPRYLQRLHGQTEILRDLMVQSTARNTSGTSYEVLGAMNCCECWSGHRSF